MKFKNDNFKRARGGSTKLLQIGCGQCGVEICTYQKDGSGTLYRMYLDRIIGPAVSLERKDLTCPEGHLIAIKMIYEKESRPAFRLLPGSIVKKLLKV
jgi:hypothetical protein